MDAADVPSLLVVGSQGVGRRSIVAGLTGSAHSEQGNLPRAWFIDTKYYTAEASVHLVNCASTAADIPRAEALILTVDATDQQTFEAVKAWHARQTATDAAEICLLVVNKMDRLRGSDGVLAREPWHEEAQDWCCDQYFEYIEVSATDAAMDGSLEDQGIRRVISALHAHTWPGLQMKAHPQSSNGTHASANGVALQNGRAEASSVASAAHVVAAGDVTGVPEGSSHPESAQEEASSSGAAHANGAFELSGEGAGADEFERLMGNVSAMRSTLQGLPDTERRARAANMAMQMLGALGLEEDSEDDKED